MMTPGLSQIAVMKVVEIKSHDIKPLDRKDNFLEIAHSQSQRHSGRTPQHHYFSIHKQLLFSDPS